MSKIISGKEIGANERARIKADVEKLKSESGITPRLSVIIVGSDPASCVYVRNKHRSCLEVGMLSDVFELPENTTQEELEALVDKLNADESVHGILCQLPLPKHLDEQRIIRKISVEKDVDAFHAENVGNIMLGKYSYLPCTPAGVMVMLRDSGIDVEGKECVVIGRSNIVGKPMAMLLINAGATVTVCHSKTRDLPSVTKRADIIVCAVGRAKFLTADMVKDGTVVIDVGINRDENGKLCGDVDFENVEPKASAITPVPGGVGPMTITMLLRNTLTAAQKKANG